MKTSITIILLVIMLNFEINLTAQIAINNDGSNPNSSAVLDLKSTNKGFLIPRMSQTQIAAISNPANGLQVFNTDDSKLYIYVLANNQWKEVQYGSGLITPVFTCGNSLIDTRNGQSYNTVQIGTQCWMGENLNIGILIPSANIQTNNDTIEKYCYNDNITNCTTYGGLYLWDEMMQYVTTESTQGICPEGWHLPSDNEWKTLEMALGMSQKDADTSGFRGTDESGQLKEAGTTHWYSPNTGATNSSNFTALPGGYRYDNGTFLGLGNYGILWTTTQDSDSTAWSRRPCFVHSELGRFSYVKSYSCSIRCLKD